MDAIHDCQSPSSTHSDELDAEGEIQPEEDETLTEEMSKDANEATCPVKRAQSPARRPLTRSQTGRVIKRRRPDESPLPEVKQKVARAPKKAKTTPEQAGGLSNVSASSGEITVAALTPRQISAPKRGHTPEPLDELLEDPPIGRPNNKLRANLPVPVPNLTKKSRGRRVPTKLADDTSNSSNPKDATRMYICKVESCGKCFHRGEHLKRHIRSIHTHEKPFKCTYPACNKHFNRHDNLLQHLKVHRDLAASETSAADDGGSPIELRRNSPSPLYADHPPPQLQPYYPSNTSYEATLRQPRMPEAYHPRSSSYNNYDAYDASIAEPTSFRTNMAVSSLRTEIPHSPPRSRA
ncbi:hypothetical protein DXG01_009311 [Tephrocybe rancida]|nr:hypothetical protein DXG01_009311 [Tephrocybe rancida]